MCIFAIILHMNDFSIIVLLKMHELKTFRWNAKLYQAMAI